MTRLRIVDSQDTKKGWRDARTAGYDGHFYFVFAYISQFSPTKQGPVFASENLISGWLEFHSIILIWSVLSMVTSQPIIVKCGTLLCNATQKSIASLNFGIRAFLNE